MTQTDKNALAIDPLMDSINGQIMRTIDTVSSFNNEPRELLCIDAGKALVLLGCSYIGNAMRITAPEPALEIGRNCIEQFQLLAQKAIVQQSINLLVSQMDPATRAKFRDPERFMLAKSMERCRMSALPEVTGDPAGDRCCGSMICERCGQNYYVHPMDWRVIGHGDVPFLNIICDGSRVKL